MSSLSHRYPEFPTSAAPSFIEEPQTPDVLEDARTSGFETGYQAGWEDAVAAFEDDKNRVTSDLAQNLQDISFTHAEAVSKLIQALEPLFAQITAKLLPGLIYETLAVHLIQTLNSMVKEQLEDSVAIAVAPENFETMQELLSPSLNIPFSLEKEPALASGQIYFRTKAEESELDFDSIIASITAAKTAFFQQYQEDVVNG